VRRILLISCFILFDVFAAAADHVVTSRPCNLNETGYPASDSNYIYKILGDRSTRALKICSKGISGKCKTIAIHKFDIDCNGDRIRWDQLVSWHAREGKLKSKNNTQDQIFVVSRERILFVDYKPSKILSGQVRVELPVGYAPLDEVGAHIQRASDFRSISFKFVSSARAAEPAIVHDTTRSYPQKLSRLAQFESEAEGVYDGNTKTHVDKALNRPQLKGSSLYEPSDAGLGRVKGHSSEHSDLRVANMGKLVPSADTWSTTVIEAASSQTSNHNLQQSMIATILGLALITSLVSGIGWFATQRIISVRARQTDPYKVILRREVTDLTRPDAQMCTELCRTSQGLIGDIQSRTEEIKGAAPLRRVLMRELKSMEQFLDTTLKTSPEDPKEWRRMRLRLQRVVTDLIRLKDIADSARRSLSSNVVTDELPRDKNEAYEVLGANPEAPERILKRLVDALRATWHPDLAAGDDDREMRNRRIKQINVAWDLITEKRIEADG